MQSPLTKPYPSWERGMRLEQDRTFSPPRHLSSIEIPPPWTLGLSLLVCRLRIDAHFAPLLPLFLSRIDLLDRFVSIVNFYSYQVVV